MGLDRIKKRFEPSLKKDKPRTFGPGGKYVLVRKYRTATLDELDRETAEETAEALKEAGLTQGEFQRGLDDGEF